jgi:choline-glycine betaine transporter
LIFTCGVAVGLFYFAAEPMWHYKGWGGARFIASQGNYHSKAGDTITRNPSGEDAVHAVMVTWYHWGIHGWIPYTTIGALLGLLTYRRG